MAIPCANPVVAFVEEASGAFPGRGVPPLEKTTLPEGALPLLEVSTVAVSMTVLPDGTAGAADVREVVVLAFVMVTLTDVVEALGWKLASPL